jgi:hypothetical protein
MRGSTGAAAFIGGLSCVAIVFVLHGVIVSSSARDRLNTTKTLTEVLGLTDIALFTEARYTRHRSMADLHSAFQDAPMAIEHFPAGSLIAPPKPQAGRLETRSEGE